MTAKPGKESSKVRGAALDIALSGLLTIQQDRRAVKEHEPTMSTLEN